MIADEPPIKSPSLVMEDIIRAFEYAHEGAMVYRACGVCVAGVIGHVPLPAEHARGVLIRGEGRAVSVSIHVCLCLLLRVKLT